MLTREDSNKYNRNFMYKRWIWYVYILELKNGYYYTGRTWDSSIRYEQHLSKFGGKYTARFGVKKLVYLEVHEDYELTKLREAKIKDMNRVKKEKLIQTYQAIVPSGEAF